MCGIEGRLDVLRSGARDLAQRVARHRCDIFEIASLDRGSPPPADVVGIALLEIHMYAPVRAGLDGLGGHISTSPFCRRCPGGTRPTLVQDRTGPPARPQCVVI